MWRQTGMGLFVITDNSGDFAPADQFLGIAGVYIDQEEIQWSGEMFYALGSQYHGKGIMSEACGAVVGSFKSLPDSGSLYAVYWRILNPASRRIFRRLGFVEDGYRSLLDEYSVERVEGIRAFEIWRLRHSPAQQLSRVLEEVSIKLGHCVAEGIFSREDCLKEIVSIIPTTEDAAALRPIIDAGLKQGLEEPGVAMMRLQKGLAG